MKRLSIALVKIGLSAAILAYLVMDARQDAAFANLRDQPKHWGLLAAAWVLCTAAVVLTLIRWHVLARALTIPCSLRSTLRIGFLGYLFNLAPMGIVGGDLLKAYMLGRQYPGNRAKAFASVVVDRLIGLYMLFVVATAAILASGFWQIPEPVIQQICLFTFLITGIGGLGILVLHVPALTEGRITRAVAGLPRIGPTLHKLIDAVRMYRRQPGVMLVAAVMSVGVHSCFAAGVFLIACGLPGHHHTLGAHFVIMPLAAATGVIPLPLGPFEYVLEFFYTHVPAAGVAITKGQGLVVALAYRIITVLIAMIGVCYYLGARREVAEVMHEADQATAGDSVVEAAGRPASAV